MSTSHVEFYKGKICGVLFVVFLCGVAAGGVGLRVYQAAVPSLPEDIGGLNPASDPSAAVEHLRDELKLDDQQYSQVHSVLDECIMQEADMVSRIQALRSEGRERIEKILNDQQRERFRTLLLESPLSE
ncbi:MAG: hypothetical protein O2968_23125 [Acidobacteria bacterium]|nr:hypothetical protein [Acidobacteriota bacterium]